jgi:hypothetical protein
VGFGWMKVRVNCFQVEIKVGGLESLESGIMDCGVIEGNCVLEMWLERD